MSEDQELSAADVKSGDDFEFWRLVLESHRQSGMSVSAFCRREGISSSSFYNWQKRLTYRSRPLSGLSQAEPVVSSEIGIQPRFVEVGSIGSCTSRLRVTSHQEFVSMPVTAVTLNCFVRQ
jgi:hypothetical protein